MPMSDDLLFDPNKQQINIQKHDDIDFYEANSALNDPYALYERDFGDYNGEEQYFTIGMSDKGRLIIVNWCIFDDKFRIFSSRLCTPSQRKNYEKRRR